MTCRASIEKVEALKRIERATGWRDLRVGVYIWRAGEEVAGGEPWLRAPETFFDRDAHLLRAPVRGSGSRVVRVAKSEGNLVLKEFLAPNPLEVFKTLLRGPRAMRSLKSAILLERMGLPAVRAVAAGYRAGNPWRSYLVTRELTSVISLLAYAEKSAPCRHHALRSLAEIMGKLHAANLLHGDAHQANFVVQAVASPIVTMVDVDGIRECGSVGVRAAVKDLSRLLDYTEPTRSEMLRFAVLYCRARQNTVEARMLLSAMEHAYLNRARSLRFRAKIKAEPNLTSVFAGGLRWVIRDDSREEVCPVCESVEQRVNSASKLLKNSRNVTVARVPGASGRGLIVRRMNYGKLQHQFKDFFRQSRARRAFFRGLLLEQADVPTPRMLAVTEVRRFRWPVAAYTICDEVPGAQTLAAWARDRCTDSRKVIERLADVIARMHNRGFVHRDLKGSNVLLDRDLNPWLIDMDGVQFVRNVSLRQAMRDLAVLDRAVRRHPRRLWFGVRFLKRYGHQRQFTDTDIALMWQHL